MYLGIVNGKQFEEAYNRISESKDMIPVASTLIESQTKGYFHAWIFYNRSGGKR